MKKLRFSIRIKVLLLLVTLLLIIFGLITVLFVRNTVHSLRQTLTNEAQSFAALATEPIGKTFELYKDSGTVRIDQQVAQFTDLSPIITNVAVYDLTGKIAYKQNDQPLPTLSAQQASSFDRISIHGTNGELTAIVQPFIEDNGVHRYNLLYLISNSEIEHSIRSGIMAIVGLAVLTLVLTGLMLFLAMNHFLLRPIRRVSQAALTISSGALDKEIIEEGHDEIGDLASSVNAMANSLKADIIKLREVDKLKSEFMMIASHNLRTPLTVINGYLETMQAMALPEKAQNMINTITASSTRLTNLAENMLTIAELEAGHKLGSETEPIDLTELTKKLASAVSQPASEHQLTFSYIPPGAPIMVQAAAKQLRMAIWNLIDNALKFTKAGGQFSLEVSRSDEQAYVVVRDNGIGINPNEMTKLFTKFHRGTSTMEYNYEGTGIGLYIARLFIREFGGDITATSELGKGSVFTIHLPLIQTTPTNNTKTQPDGGSINS